ncbi:hypothetical protein [Methylocaldum marinum]|uniref:hypothetical protein n=1 Tax=Methylocaldum marinum TaxID=1432792 RepID=UPI000E68D3E7|nr:hypothetical protein [Methylocaldum marinum]
MGLYDRNWYRDEVCNRRLVRDKNTRRRVSRHGRWIAAVLIPFIIYHLFPDFQFKVDTFWASVKARYFTDTLDMQENSETSSDAPQPTEPGSISPRPEVPPQPYNDPRFYRKPNNDPPFDWKREKTRTADNRKLLA